VTGGADLTDDQRSSHFTTFDGRNETENFIPALADQINVDLAGKDLLDVTVGCARQLPEPLFREIFDARTETNAEDVTDSKDRVSKAVSVSVVFLR